MTIRDTFERLDRRDELALIPYMTAGFPTLDKSIEHLLLLARSGADILEVGIPFSDPIADGPTIQYSSHLALERGFRLPDMFTALKGVRFDVPLVAMSYLNPLMVYEKQALFRQMDECGIQGLIVPDLPIEESQEWIEAGRAFQMGLIFLATPTSPPERIRRIAQRSDGFLYYVSVTGTTGTRDELPVGLTGSLEKIKELTGKPVVVGFGISQPAHVRRLRGVADGVVVGSRIIEAVRRSEDMVELVQDLKKATRSPCDVDCHED